MSHVSGRDIDGLGEGVRELINRALALSGSAPDSLAVAFVDRRPLCVIAACTPQNRVIWCYSAGPVVEAAILIPSGVWRIGRTRFPVVACPRCGASRLLPAAEGSQDHSASMCIDQVYYRPIGASGPFLPWGWRPSELGGRRELVELANGI